MVHLLCQTCNWPFLYFSIVDHALIRKINIFSFFISYKILSYTVWNGQFSSLSILYIISSHVHYIFCLFLTNVDRHSKSTTHQWSLAHSTKGFSQHLPKIILNEYLILLIYIMFDKGTPVCKVNLNNTMPW